MDIKLSKSDYLPGIGKCVLLLENRRRTKIHEVLYLLDSLNRGGALK